MDLLEADFARVIEAALDRTARAAANALRPAITAASSAGVSPDDIAVLTATWQSEVDGVLLPYVGEVYSGSATSIAIGLADSFPDPDLPGIPLLVDEYTLTYLKTVAPQFADIGSELWEDIRNELLDGVKQGSSIEQIADRIVHVAGFTKQKSTLIARTQVHSASESGSIAQLRFMGYGTDEVTKEWVATLGDGRTRPTHIAADGQKVGIDEKFTVGGYPLDFPGDPSGPPDEVYSCRCTSVFEIDEKPKFRCSGQLVAASPPGTTTCVVPIKKPDISHLQSTPPGQTVPLAGTIFNAFMKANITPAYGGAKIHKVLPETRALLKTQVDPAVVDQLDDFEILAAVDQYYVAKKDTFFEKYVTWYQSPAGKKALAKDPGHAVLPQALKMPVSNTPVGTAGDALSLPPVRVLGPKLVPKPDPANLLLSVTNPGGGTGASILRDAVTGDRWLFKATKKGTYSSKYTGIIDTAVAKIQSKAYQMRPAIYQIEWHGEKGTVQFMFHGNEAFPGGAFDPLKLSAQDLAVMQREQIFDWLVSNADSHSGQWIRLENGRLYGIDKGQSFKFFGSDKLDWNYQPVHLLGGTQPTYQKMWQAFVKGENIDLQDPTAGPLGDWIDRLTAIPDKEYRELIRPFAVAREKAGFGPAAKFLDDVVARKNNLKQDFADLWARAVAERAKNTNALQQLAQAVSGQLHTPPKVVPATPGVGTATSGVAGDISWLDYFAKQDILDDWVKLAGGKKVTPAWGGAKIYKQLQDLKTKYAQPGHAYGGLSDLQLLRVLDDVGGFTGKPKTYESVVVDWIKSPQSTVTILKVGNGKLDPSLNPAAVVAVKAPVKPVLPTTAVIPDEAKDVLATGSKGTAVDIFKKQASFKLHDIIAYTQTKSGDVLRIRKIDVGPLQPTTLQVQLFKNGQWVNDKTFVDSITLMKEYDLVKDEWSLVPVKMPAGVITKVPGKVAGDLVTTDEVWTSKNLWAENDIIATAIEDSGPNAQWQWRIVSDGKGDFKLQMMAPNATTWDTLPVTYTDPAMFKSSFKHLEWKLTNHVTESAKPSNIPGVAAGDGVSPADIMLAHPVPGNAIAYAYDPFTGTLNRVILDQHSAKYTMQYQNKGETNWQFAMDYDTTFQLEQDTLQFNLDWIAANKDGSIPDSLRTIMPGKSSKIPGSAVTKIPGHYQGDSVTTQLIAAFADQHSDYEVIALGVDAFGTEYRIYSIGGVYVREFKTPSGAWQYNTIITDIGDPGFGVSKMQWVATSMKASPQSIGAKDAATAVKALTKPAKTASKKVVNPTPSPGPSAQLTGDKTHITGKKVGDVIHYNDIWDNYAKYAEGQIIAQTAPKKYSYQSEFRYFVANGKLVKQKKTKAGTWAGTKIVTVKWDIESGGPGLVAKNDMIESAKLKAAQNLVAKKLPGYVAPVKTATAKAFPVTKVPSVGASNSLAKLSEADQIEIFTDFKGSSVGQLLQSSNEDAVSLMWGLSELLAKSDPARFSDLTIMQVAAAVDNQLAKKMGKTNAHLFETKITNFLNSAAGKQFISSGDYTRRPIVAEIMSTDVDVPKGFVLRPSEKVFSLPGPGAYDAQLTQFERMGTSELQQMQDRMLSGNPWTVKQRMGLRTYTSGAYHSYNQYLRGIAPKAAASTREKILHMQAGMRAIDRNILVARGTGWEQFPAGYRNGTDVQKLIGKTIQDPAFVSTSSIAQFGGFGGAVRLEIELPRGTYAAYVKSISHNKNENEVVLPAGTKFRVISVNSSGYTTIVRLRVVS